MNKIVLSFVVASLTTSSICIAASPQLANSNTSLLAGPYIGIQAGLGGIDTPDFPRHTKHDVAVLGGDFSEDNDWGFAGRLFGGYLWQTNKFQYGLELGGMIYPNNTYKLDIDIPLDSNDDPLVSIKIKYKGYLIDLLGIVKYHFVSQWNLFAKAGAAYTHQKLKITAQEDLPLPAPPESLSKTRTENRILSEVAAGIGYNFIPNAELSLTYNYVIGNKLSIDSDSARAKVACVDSLMLGVSWLFG